MKNPSPTEIAQAVEDARKLIAAKSAKPAPSKPEQPVIPAHEDPNPNRLQHTRTVAKALGYVSENWRGNLRNFFVNQWKIILASTPSTFGWDFREMPVPFKDGGACFDYHDSQGWDKRTIGRLKVAHDAYLTLAHKRPKTCQKISSTKKPAKRRS